MYRFTLTAIAVFLSFRPANAEEIRVLSWNVESSLNFRQTNDPAVIAQQLTELQTDHGPYDLIALTEVRASNAATYEQAVEEDHSEYEAFTSTTGDSDRMMLMVRSDRFEVVGDDARELTRSGGPDSITFPGGNSRRPFLVELRDRENNGLEFIFMVNHLTRGNDRNRQQQAAGLREWARQQRKPIIAAGDYNFDFDFRNLTGNQSMAIFMRRPAADGGAFVWQWVIPSVEFSVTGTSDADRRVGMLVEWVDTNWAGSSGRDRFRDSMLDFIFTAQGTRDWKAEAKVIARAGDFPEDGLTSDDLSVEETFGPAASGVDVGGPSG